MPIQQMLATLMPNRNWLEELINSDQAYGFSNLVLSGFLRVVTHPRVSIPPATWPQQLHLPRDFAASPRGTGYSGAATLGYFQEPERVQPM